MLFWFSSQLLFKPNQIHGQIGYRWVSLWLLQWIACRIPKWSLLPQNLKCGLIWRRKTLLSGAEAQLHTLSLGAQHWIISPLWGGFSDESPVLSHEELDHIFRLPSRKTVSQYMWSKETVIHTLQVLVHQILWVTTVPSSCSSEHNFCSLVHSGAQFLQESKAWAGCFHTEKSGSV